jgi:hypothetical protein
MFMAIRIAKARPEDQMVVLREKLQTEKCKIELANWLAV